MQPEAIEYPRGEFAAQYRIKNETGGFAGSQPRAFAQLKYVLPELAEGEGKKLTYDVRTALVLQAAGIRNDLTALVHKVTMKGIGLTEEHQTTHGGHETLQNVADVVFDQISLGGVNNLVQKGANTFYYHVENQIKHRIAMVRNGVHYGDLAADTFVLQHVKDLARNGFPADKFELPEKASGVVYTRMIATMSRDQIRKALEDKTYVNRRYDKSPRLILRSNHPFGLYDNWGAHPQMTAHVAFADSRKSAPAYRTLEIPLEPVQETTGYGERQA